MLEQFRHGMRVRPLEPGHHKSVVCLMKGFVEKGHQTFQLMRDRFRGIAFDGETWIRRELRRRKSPKIKDAYRPL